MELRRPEQTIPIEVSATPIVDETGTIIYAIAAFADISKRKRAEQVLKDYQQTLEQQVAERTSAIQQQWELLQTLFDHIPVMLTLSDTSGELMLANQAMERILGWSTAELTTLNLLAECYPDPAAHEHALTHLQAATGQWQDFKTRCRDGRWIDTTWATIRLSDGKLISIGQDISDRKQIEAALQENQEQFRQVAENLPLFLGLRTIDYSQWLYVSPKFEHISGRSSQMMLEDPQSWRSFVHPEDQPTVVLSLEHPEPTIHEFRIFRPDQEMRWIRTVEFPVYIRDSEPYRVATFAEDITERKQIEAALRTSEERLFDNAPIGIALVALTGQFLQVNPSFYDIVGYSATELMTLTWQAITHPDDLNLNLQRHQQLVAGDVQSYQLEKRKFVPVLLNVALLRDQGGQPLYTITHVVGMSDRYEVDRMKDEFISIVSHELRTPLTAIRGALQLLESGLYDAESDEYKEMLHIASSNSERLVRLVNDILDLERLESNRVQLEMEDCQIAEVIQHALESVRALADTANITLSTSLPSISMWAAPDAIVQTLVNLLSNAIKFSSPGNTVWLRAELETDDRASRQEICFSVEDKGRGIPADKLATIFERFQQVDASDSRQKGGTGLGLAICKTIVQQHGGKIWVESEVGKGSTFYFTVPRSPSTTLLSS